MSYIQITPSQSTTLITKIFIVAVRAELYKNATISVDLFSNDTFVRNELVVLTDSEYNQWNTDDDIVAIVLDKLAFQRLTDDGKVIPPVQKAPVVVEEKKEEP